MYKQSYNVFGRLNCPLFSSYPHFTAQNFETNPKIGNVRYKHVNDTIYRLLVVNPLRKKRILERLTQQELS